MSAVKDLPDVPSLHVDVREPRAQELRVPTQETFIDAELSTLAPEIDGT